jgi:hypothetical protein
VPGRRPLITLRDAALYITKLPKAEHDAVEWQAAMEALLLVAERDGPTMFARIGVMRALNRHVERVLTRSERIIIGAGGSWRGIDDEIRKYRGVTERNRLPRHSVDTAMSPIRCSYRCARKIWIGDALGGAAGCRLGALRQRGIAACDGAATYVVGLQADRIVGIIRLGLSRRRRQNCCDR